VDNVLIMMSKALVFRKLNKKELTKLCELAVCRDLKKGQIISLYNDLLPYIILVQKGIMVMARESHKGHSLVLRTFKPGDIFLGHAIIDGGPTPGTLQAIQTNTRIYLWHKDHLMPIIKQNPEALWEITTILMKRMREASNTINQMAFEDVLTRLASLILDEYYSKDQHQVPRNMTLDDMAARIGTKREVVCRLLYRLRDKGIIEITRNQFLIKDIENLKLLAKDI